MAKATSDVFLSYNSGDSRIVEALASRLQALGITAWFDQWKIVPGTSWQAAIEKGLDGSKSCAVLVGKKGLGPWQSEEMRAAIQQRVGTNNQFRVIPVLLLGGRRPKKVLPSFLVNTQWVRLAHDLDRGDGLHRLAPFQVMRAW